MPSARRVDGPSKPVKKSRSGVWDRVQPVGEVDDLGLKVCLFGRSGSGKTTMACTFPKPLLLVGMEDGTKSVRDEEDVQFVRVWNTNELKELAEGVVENGFKTVVLDTATSLQDAVLCEILGLEKLPVQLAWGMVSQHQYRDRAEKTKNLMRLFVDLADQGPTNVVILAQEKDHNPKGEEGKKRAEEYDPTELNMPFIAPSLGGSTTEWLCNNMDYICQTFTRLRVERKVRKVNKEEVVTERVTDQKEFCLRMEKAHPVFASKIRASKRLTVPPVLVSPDYDKFVAALAGEPTEE